MLGVASGQWFVLVTSFYVLCTLHSYFRGRGQHVDQGAELAGGRHFEGCDPPAD